MDPETIRTAIEAEGNESINCPVCGESIPAFELGSDHAHTTELLEAVVTLLPEETESPETIDDADGPLTTEEAEEAKEAVEDLSGRDRDRLDAARSSFEDEEEDQ